MKKVISKTTMIKKKAKRDFLQVRFDINARIKVKIIEVLYTTYLLEILLLKIQSCFYAFSSLGKSFSLSCFRRDADIQADDIGAKK